MQADLAKQSGGKLRDEKINILHATTSVASVKVSPYAMEPSWLLFRWFGKRRMMHFYTVGCFKNMKVVPLKLQVTNRIISCEYTTSGDEERPNFEGENADPLPEPTVHYLTTEWLYQGLASPELDNESPFCQPTIANFNFVLDD